MGKPVCGKGGLPLGEKWRLAAPPQPLVFRYEGTGALCRGLGRLAKALPEAHARLCLHRGCCYLAVYAAFSQRGAAAAAAGGVALGASPVHYAYREEHGLPLGNAPLVELARALGADPPG